MRRQQVRLLALQAVAIAMVGAVLLLLVRVAAVVAVVANFVHLPQGRRLRQARSSQHRCHGDCAVASNTTAFDSEEG